MAIDKICGNIVAIGPHPSKPGQHDLTPVYGEVTHFLQNKLKSAIYNFNSSWQGGSYVTYTSKNLSGVSALPSIEVYNYPIAFEDWGAILRESLPSKMGSGGGPKLITAINQSLPVILSQKSGKSHLSRTTEDEIKTIKRVYEWSTEVYTRLKKREGVLTPKRHLGLLFDNGERFFTPRAFEGYIERNEKCPAYACTGELSRT